ncbi:MAG: YhcH/YjgK/YiaL family protein [Desulfobulbaceae bacterium]|nr:YhcH/YjgK/YiaL family protein [Desulfobulbaceae bacterium]
MIMDIVENAPNYLSLHKGFAKAIEFLLRPDLPELPVARYEIAGDRVYAMVSKDFGTTRESGQLETHEKYIDIQLILAGTDDMGWMPKSRCQKPAGAYDAEADLQFFADTPEAWLAIKNGIFVIFFPDDAHMPMISSGQIHKVVVKIAVEQP